MEAMSGSRRFLLFLVIASVTCVVLVQISMDGKNIGRNLQYSDTSEAKDPEALPVIAANPIVIQPTPTPLMKTTSSVYVTTKNIVEATQHYSKNHVNLTHESDHIEAKVQVRRLPLAKKLPAQQLTQNLVNRQERIQEILKQSNVIHRRATLDPMRSLKTIPLTDPDKVKRIFILTYFRAGSSFFGDILQQNWKTFYHFEPLHSMTYDKRIDDEKIPEVFTLFNNIFNCNFTEANNYIQWVRQPRNQFLFAHNLFLWVTCHSNPRTCFNPSFVNSACMRAPIHVVKVTRLHMRHLRNYLQDNSDMNIKVVYLTRDPRGIVSSRWTLDWCNGTNCSDSGVLCREMDEDIRIFNDLRTQQPLNFINVRYEDLALNPELETKKLFNFLDLPFSPSVKKFLKTHTVSRKADDRNPYSTRRNSSSMVLSWRERFTYKQVLDVQSQCEDVLHKLNHSLITLPNQLPYPNGKAKLNVSMKSNLGKTWRYNKNPLAKKYLLNKQEFSVKPNHPYQSFSNNNSEIFNSNNTNIEIHKSYKIVESDEKKSDLTS